MAQPPTVEPPPAIPTPERSKEYYFWDGNRIFQVEKTLYKLHEGLLRARFDVFGAMFSPTDEAENIHVGIVGEGASDNAPIIIETPQATKNEFDFLMEYTYLGETPNPSLTKLLAVKKLSAQWGSIAGQTWALTHLRMIQKTIPVCLRLRIGRSYEMEDWISTCVRELIKKPLLRLKPQDVEWLGLGVYVFIARAREQYHVLHRTVGMCPPSIDDERDLACQTHDTCVKGWQYTWFMEISKSVLHPELTFEMAFWELEDRIREMDLTNLMGVACAAAAKAKALASAGLQSEDTLLTQAMMYLAQNVPVEHLNGIPTTW